MFNFLGKILILLNVAFSMLFVGVTVALFLISPDLGGTLPKEEVSGAVASEVDKRIAAVNKAIEWKYQAFDKLQKAKSGLQQREMDRAANYIWYVQKITEMDSSPANTIKINRVKTLASLNSAGRYYQTDVAGRPVLENQPVTYTVAAKTGLAKTMTLDKSYKQYLKRFADLREEHERYVKEHNEWLDRQNFIIDQRKRVPDPKGGPPLSPGILDLIQAEIENQERLRAEKRSIDKLWVKESYGALQLEERQFSLMDRLQELKQALAKRRTLKK
ncbi:MAG: hypothetical protein ACFCD0_18955 [Gemmataceae bacterium]